MILYWHPDSHTPKSSRELDRCLIRTSSPISDDEMFPKVWDQVEYINFKIEEQASVCL